MRPKICILATSCIQRVLAATLKPEQLHFTSDSCYFSLRSLTWRGRLEGRDAVDAECPCFIVCFVSLELGHLLIVVHSGNSIFQVGFYKLIVASKETMGYWNMK